VKVKWRRFHFFVLVLMGAGLWPHASQAGFPVSLGNPSGDQTTLNSLEIPDRNVLDTSPGVLRKGPMVQREARSGAVIDFSSKIRPSVPFDGHSRVEALGPQKTPAIPEPASLLLLSIGTMLVVAPTLRRWARPAGLA
jgi:hypothetical protein